MDVKTYLIFVLVMAGVTYLIRVIPFVAFRKKVKNKYFKSFLAYVPYAVLGAMTFPAIFTSTESVISASIGCAVAMLLAFMEKSLLTVALSACGVVLVVELVSAYIL